MMKQQNAVVALVLLLFVAFTSAATPPQCNGFRITSPTTPGLQWTAGQCYGVSFDKGASQVVTVDAVDLYPAGGSQKVDRLWTGPVQSTAITTGNFNLDTHQKTGDFYFAVYGTTANGSKCRFDTINFHVTYNPNSPPATC